jgi:hypothetical protein
MTHHYPEGANTSMRQLLNFSHFFIWSALLIALSACMPMVSGSAYADNGPPLPTTHSGKAGAKIILLQQPGLPTRAHMLGLETTAEALNAMDAAGFTITTYDFETKLGTEYGIMKDARPMSKELHKAQLGELPKGITKEVYIEVIMDRPGELLDDAAWLTVTNNFINLAAAARELNETGDYNFKGVVFDNEDYRSEIFNCDDYRPGVPCNEYRDKMYQRGKDIMRGMLEAWPDIIVMHMHGPYTSDCERPEYIAGVGVPCFDLKGSFFAGMVQAVSENPGAHPLLNGGQDYVLYSSNDFQKHYNYIEDMGRNESLDFIPESLRPLWAENVETSFMVYNKRIARRAGGGSNIVFHTDLSEPRTQLQNARCVADSIVWFYIEDRPEAHWYYAMPPDWRDEVLRPALEYTCPDTSEAATAGATAEGQ